MQTSFAVSQRPPRRAALALLLPVALMLLTALMWHPVSSAAFLATTSFGALSVPHGSQARSLRRVARLAKDSDVVDAEMVEDDGDGEEEVEIEKVAEEDGEFAVAPTGRTYPDEAYMEYKYDETPPESWFERRKIDKHQVNMKFFDMFAKPKSFFPVDLRPGDTVRVSFLDPAVGEDYGKGKMREVHFDGIIMNFKGAYHSRTMILRAMVGKGASVMGMEVTLPIHSPLVTGIEVLRRGYIGQNKNAYFLRALVGKKNQLPEDKERTRLDEFYEDLRQERRFDEIPEAEYPQRESERYPLPVWKQDMDDWDESQYDPEKVDQRNDFEKRVIGGFKKRLAKSF